MKYMQSNLINYWVDDNNVIIHWQRVPFDKTLPYIAVDNPKSIHVGFDKVINGVLIKNDTSYKKYQHYLQSKQEKEKQILKLKNELRETDYMCLKYVDKSLSYEEYKPIKELRQLKRNEINKLEQELLTLEGEQNDTN